MFPIDLKAILESHHLSESCRLELEKHVSGEAANTPIEMQVLFPAPVFKIQQLPPAPLFLQMAHLIPAPKPCVTSVETF